jgi:epoxyqueuosine reductase QueG
MITKTRLEKLAKDLGTDLFAVADVSGIKEQFNLDKDAIKDLNRAICLGARVSQAILDQIKDHPTRLYFHHYRSLNMFLDQMALRLANILQDEGYLSLPVPASQIVDWTSQSAHLSHKQIGYLAGLGWIGRNNLLVNERLGSQFRLVTILTNLDIPADRPLSRDCGDCFACIKVCPAGAIKEKKEEFDHIACFEKLKEFQKRRFVDQYICGICVKACRHTTSDFI